MLDARFSILDARCWILDGEYLILDAGSSILDDRSEVTYIQFGFRVQIYTAFKKMVRNTEGSYKRLVMEDG